MLVTPTVLSLSLYFPHPCPHSQAILSSPLLSSSSVFSLLLSLSLYTLYKNYLQNKISSHQTTSRCISSINGRFLFFFVFFSLASTSYHMITTKDWIFNLTDEKIYNYWEEKIYNYWEEKMNSPQIYTDSYKQVLMETMLNQEVIFSKQVNELHRLYMIQKTLMDDFGWREYSGYNSMDASRQFAFGPFENQIRYEPQENGETLSTVPMVGSTHFINNYYVQEGRGVCSRLQQRPVDLQLSSALNINNINGGGLAREEEVKLSLSIGRESKIIQSSSQHIIDLEEDSVETVSNETNPVLPLGCDTSKTDSFLDERETCLDWKSFNQEFDECRSLSCDNSKLVIDKVVSSYKPGRFDLNKPEFHDDSCSTPISVKEPNTNNHSCNVFSTSTKTNEEASDSKACTIDLGSLSGPTSDRSEDPNNHGDNTKHQNVETYIMIQKTAASLIYISLGNENTITKGKSKEKPQSSTDSYESIVLKLKESVEDDNCVSSNAFEANELDERDCGIKLKRGRRMKDFQKDILPGLASLSRREIWEDVKIMEGVIRSREYKKLKANRMATSGENWFTPVRSRRSRLNYVGRRYYS